MDTMLPAVKKDGQLLIIIALLLIWGAVIAFIALKVPAPWKAFLAVPAAVGLLVSVCGRFQEGVVRYDAARD